MAKYQIPPQFINGFTILAKLSEAECDQLTLVLAGIESAGGPKQLSEKLEKGGVANPNAVAATIFSFSSLFYSFKGDDYNSLATDLSQSFQLQYKSDQPEAGIAKKLEGNLKKIFPALSSLRFTFKAMELLQENERVFQDARILTDIRLVLDNSENVTASEKRGLILHQFRITFMKNAMPEECFYTLDSEDLSNLQGIINRALQKEESIRSEYSKVVPFVDLNNVSDGRNINL